MAPDHPTGPNHILNSCHRRPSTYCAFTAIHYQPPDPSSFTAHRSSNTSQLLHFLQQPSPHLDAQHQPILNKLPQLHLPYSYYFHSPASAPFSFKRNQISIYHILILHTFMGHSRCRHLFTCSFHDILEPTLQILSPYVYLYHKLPPSLPDSFSSSVSSLSARHSFRFASTFRTSHSLLIFYRSLPSSI